MQEHENKDCKMINNLWLKNGLTTLHSVLNLRELVLNLRELEKFGKLLVIDSSVIHSENKNIFGFLGFSFQELKE